MPPETMYLVKRATVGVCCLNLAGTGLVALVGGLWWMALVQFVGIATLLLCAHDAKIWRS